MPRRRAMRSARQAGRSPTRWARAIPSPALTDARRAKVCGEPEPKPGSSRAAPGKRPEPALARELRGLTACDALTETAKAKTPPKESADGFSEIYTAARERYEAGAVRSGPHRRRRGRRSCAQPDGSAPHRREPGAARTGRPGRGQGGTRPAGRTGCGRGGHPERRSRHPHPHGAARGPGRRRGLRRGAARCHRPERAGGAAVGRARGGPRRRGPAGGPHPARRRASRARRAPAARNIGPEEHRDRGGAPAAGGCPAPERQLPGGLGALRRGPVDPPGGGGGRGGRHRRDVERTGRPARRLRRLVRSRRGLRAGVADPGRRPWPGSSGDAAGGAQSRPCPVGSAARRGEPRRVRGRGGEALGPAVGRARGRGAGPAQPGAHERRPREARRGRRPLHPHARGTGAGARRRAPRCFVHAPRTRAPPGTARRVRRGGARDPDGDRLPGEGPRSRASAAGPVPHGAGAREPRAR